MVVTICSTCTIVHTLHIRSLHILRFQEGEFALCRFDLIVHVWLQPVSRGIV